MIANGTDQWRRQDFVTGGSEVWVYRGPRVWNPQSRLYCLCINVALCSTALQCICRVIRRNSMAMKAHTHILHNFWTSTHSGEASPLAAPLLSCRIHITYSRRTATSLSVRLFPCVHRTYASASRRVYFVRDSFDICSPSPCCLLTEWMCCLFADWLNGLTAYSSVKLTILVHRYMTQNIDKT